MRRKHYLTLLLTTLAVAGWLVASALSQRDAGPMKNGKPAPDPLPITQVVLFNSGMSYFLREGPVTDEAQINLSFATDDINDLLKSLVLEDLGGGKVSAINYDSHDPIDRILRSFALDLNTNPTFGQLLNQARGEKIDVALAATATTPMQTVSGTIVGMEQRLDATLPAVPTQIDVLNLLGSDGLKSVALSRVERVRFQNPVLESELQRALQVLASSHDSQKKTVSLAFKGAGQRRVRVGYVVERPIWKMTYRLQLEPQNKVHLQGWALVDNTSDYDWQNVKMSLVSGRPISFKMNLYEPLYLPRPTVEPDLFASLRPPVYGGALDPKQAQNPGQQQQGQLPALQGFQGGLQIGGFQIGGFQGGQFQGQIGGLNQYQVQQQNPNLANAGQNRLSYDELVKRRAEQQAKKKEVAEVGKALTALNFKEGITSVASAEEIGDYFHFRLEQKVNLPRQKSAMLPVFNTTIEGAKVSIYNPLVHARHPLLGLRLKNTSGKPLTQGPITVYDEHVYAGDTRILTIQPNESRLLSYALDLGTELVTGTKTLPGPAMTFRIGSANLTAQYILRQTRTYLVRNRTQQDRTLIIEHPIRQEWNLVDPVKPSEKTRDHYRFQVEVPKESTARLEVVEEQLRVDPIVLAGGKDVAPFYAVATGIEVKPVVKADPREMIDLKLVKGFLHEKYRQRESKTYYVQNNSEQERTFAIDHLIRPDWVRRTPDGKEQQGPGIFRHELKVKAKSTGALEVVEEKTDLEKSRTLKGLSETVIRELLQHPAVGAKVRDALQKSLTARLKLSESERQFADVERQLTALSKDQARLRDNLKIIPPNSDPYKEFLDKFVKQERQIEQVQERLRSLEGALEKQRGEYETLVNTLTAG